jgi:hypothetical protein
VWAEDTNSSRYSPRHRFNWKKLHVPPRTVGITAHCVQYIIHTGLCRVCWLLVWVTEWTIVTVLQAARYRFRTPVDPCDILIINSTLNKHCKVCHYGEDWVCSFRLIGGVLIVGFSAPRFSDSCLVGLLFFRCARLHFPLLCKKQAHISTGKNASYSQSKML